jgi:hypothetical protein
MMVKGIQSEATVNIWGIGGAAETGATVPVGVGPVNPSGVMTAMRRAGNAGFESIPSPHPEQGNRIPD